MFAINGRKPDALDDRHTAARRSADVPLKHDFQLETCGPSSESFQHPKFAEPFQHLAYVTKIALKAVSCGNRSFWRNVDWRLDQAHEPLNRQVFAEEKRIAGHVTNHFISRHFPVMLEILKSPVLAKYQELSQAPAMTTRHPTMDFKCTRYLLTNFTKRNQLSSRCTRTARRPAIDPEEVEKYRVELGNVDSTTRCGRILNADKSFWLMLYLQTKTGGPTGRETVQVNVNKPVLIGRPIIEHF
jgi:hypothetical protein